MLRELFLPRSQGHYLSRTKSFFWYGIEPNTRDWRKKGIGYLFVKSDVLVSWFLGYCNAPDPFRFAKLKVQTNESEFPIGTSLKYECLPEYYGKSFTIKCLENLTWSSAKDVCKREYTLHWHFPMSVKSSLGSCLTILNFRDKKTLLIQSVRIGRCRSWHYRSSLIIGWNIYFTRLCQEIFAREKPFPTGK